MSCARQLESNKGFTLIEIIMVVVVLGILSAFTFSFIDSAVKTYTMVSKQRMLYQEASFVMERISRELRDAQGMCIFFGMWCTQVSQSGNVDDLLFQKRNTTATIDNNNQVRFYISNAGSQNLIYRYSFTGIFSNLRDYVFASKVTRFDITRINQGTCNENVTIDLTVTDDDQSVSLSTRISPKNFDGPSGNRYSSRCFNGDYEDVIQ